MLSQLEYIVPFESIVITGKISFANCILQFRLFLESKAYIKESESPYISYEGIYTLLSLSIAGLQTEPSVVKSQILSKEGNINEHI